MNILSSKILNGSESDNSKPFCETAGNVGAPHRHLHRHICDTQSKEPPSLVLADRAKEGAQDRTLDENTCMKSCARIQDMCSVQSPRKVFLQHTELNGDIWNSLRALRGWHKSWSSPAFSHQHLLALPHSLGSPSRQVCFFSIGRSAGQHGKGTLPNYCYRWFSFSKDSWRPLRNRSFKLLKVIWWWRVKQ